LNVEDLERKCPSCGHKFVPRKSDSHQRCPECNAKLPKVTRKYLTRKELRLYWLLHVMAGLFIFVLGIQLMFIMHETTGILWGFIGLLFFLVLGMPYFFEHRIYDLIHGGKPVVKTESS
jgi:predicted RNA-binding Zn-ribbon protein involved in translation (DUF1610 family)